MIPKLLKWKGGSGVTHARVSPLALSVALLICSAVWLVSACACYATSASKDGLSGTPLFWMLTLMVTPSICFAFGVILVDSRQPLRLSWFDWCSLLAAFFPVTLGSLLAVWVVKVWFWANFQETSVALKIFGVLASLALVAISGTVIWKTTLNYLTSKRLDARQVA
jgi:hypothetical protein